MEKKEYVAPKVSVYGDVREITRGNTNGIRVDGDFTEGQIATFS